MSNQSSFGKLFIVATPIGNLEDITLRALKVLQDVDYIACEHSEVTRKLLNHFKITQKKILVHHKFNENNGAQGLVDLILKKYNVALVSDAGTPTISDPGFPLIKLAIQHQIPIEIIPGPSAVISAIALANFTNEFTFLGFLKDKSGQRINQLKKLSPGTYVAFVSPYKLLKVFDDLNAVYGDELNVCLIKELTKIHETNYRGTVKTVKSIIVNQPIKGEYTLVFNFKPVKINVSQKKYFSKKAIYD